jgi:hypothetical protein
MMGDDDKGVDRSKEEVVRDGEVTSPNLSSMISQKRRPTLPTHSFAYLFHILLDCGFAHCNSQFEELTHNFLSAPEMILSGHLFDERNSLSRSKWFTVLSFGDASPVTLEHISMPTQDGIRLDDVQSRLPEVGEPSQKGQKTSVTVGKLRPFDRAFEDDKLLAEHGVLDKEVGFGARQIGDGTDCEGDIGRFGPSFDCFFDPIEQILTGIPDLRKHEDINSIEVDLRWSRMVIEMLGFGTIFACF